MKKYNSRWIFLWGFFTILIFIQGCSKQATYKTGFLEGKISIGPICPVETIPPDPGCLPTAETYKAYPVSVWSSDGKIKVAQIYPSLDGTFNMELAPGNYLVILENNQNRIGSSNLPADISIVSENTTTLIISVDTGIR